MKTLRTLKTELLADTDTRAEYDAMTAEFSMARELIAARARAGLTQGEVAQRMGTTQSVVARLEGGTYAFHPNSATLCASRWSAGRGASGSRLNRFAPASPARRKAGTFTRLLGLLFEVTP